ncbi:MAG: PD-(D/E)XK nuclease family protein, partial [Ignavibacteria bacterium]
KEKFKAKNIYKFSGFDAREEIEIIARIIKHKVIQNPELDLSKICIAINGISEYSNLVREIFYKYGIPVNVTDRFYLKNSPPIISIIRLLELLRNDFFYKDLFYVLRSTYFSFENIDVDNLRETLSLIKITRGKDKILSSIANRLDYLNSLSLNEYPQRDYEIQQLEKAKIDFYQIIELISRLEGNQTPQSFVKKLREIIHNLNVYENIFSNELAMDEDININTYSKDVRALNLFESILEELLYTFEKLQLHRKTFAFNEYFEFITTAVFGSRYNIKERWGYGVLVTSPEEIRNLNFSILFLPGLENGLFPSKYFPLVLLDEKYIRTERQRLLEERYLFYQCLNAFEDELYLSYPRQDEKKEKIPSDFLVELEKICEIQELNYKELNNFIFSRSELFEKYSVDQLLDLNKENRELFARLSKVKEVVKRISYRINNEIESEGKEYCGIITDKKLLEMLYSKFDKEFSITELETYAQCPFKYFLNYIVQPQIEEEIEEDIQRNEFGLIIHQILYQFLNKLKSENRNLYDELKNNYDQLSAEILEIAKGILKHFERYNPFFFLTEEIILGSSQRKSIIIEFLNLEKRLIEDSDYTFQPFEFEKTIIQEFNLDDERFKLKGKIDRIDLNLTDNTFKVLDYKTGELPKPTDYKDRISLQLPLYLILVERYFQSINEDLKISDAEFVKLSSKKSNNIERKSLIKDFLNGQSNELMNELDEVMKTVASMIEKIKNGKFNLTTIKNFERRVCSKCNYQGICRIDLIKQNAPEDEITS